MIIDCFEMLTGMMIGSIALNTTPVSGTRFRHQQNCLLAHKIYGEAGIKGVEYHDDDHDDVHDHDGYSYKDDILKGNPVITEKFTLLC